MSKKVNTTMIGIFIVGGLVLILIALFLFGARDYFSKKESFVLYFKGSVNGLTVGAPVKFKGVNVGTVTNIALVVNQKTLSFSIPVIIQFQSAKVTYSEKDERTIETRYADLIKKGLRAQLESASLLTGQLYVELDFDPNAPATLEKNTTPYLQIPTIPSSSEAFDKALTAATNAMDSINNFFSSRHLANSIKSLNKTLQSSDKAIANINNQVSPAFIRLEQTLEEVTDSMRAIKELADYLDRNPSAFITGKGNY